MTTYYSPSKHGFYDDVVNDTLPKDAVEISKELHEELLVQQTQGKVIVLDSDGLPTAIDPQDPTGDDLLARCKVYAGRLLAATDWAVMPDVVLVNGKDFVEYRRKVRALRINPVTSPDWPDLPKPVWGKE